VHPPAESLGRDGNLLREFLDQVLGGAAEQLEVTSIQLNLSVGRQADLTLERVETIAVLFLCGYPAVAGPQLALDRLIHLYLVPPACIGQPTNVAGRHDTTAVVPLRILYLIQLPQDV